MKYPKDTPNNPFAVYCNGELVCKINEELVRSRNIDEAGLERLRELHVQRYSLEEAMKNTDKRTLLKELFYHWTINQYELQDIWGFERNSDFHPSHRLPKCTCPKLDNDDRLGTLYKVVDSTCPLHGDN